ncbi:MAG: hypothetical protein GX558_12025 [Clostridiales bacterium]|nr:hypothetical protein [Clostridiales bacterium]
MIDRPLTREEVAAVVEGRGAARRVPIAIQQWVDPCMKGAEEAECRAILRRYPCDIEKINFRIPTNFDAPPDAPSYRWLHRGPSAPQSAAFDACAALSDWRELDAMLADFPSAAYRGLIPGGYGPKGDRYRVGLWWYWLFERHWSLRGMENALCDFYDHGDEVHRLYRAFTDFYKDMLLRGRRELGLDAVWTSDDIGTQTAPFFSPAVFREFFKPYYRELIDCAHELGMHFWLHCCGNILPFIPDLIDISLDVLHPIQKYAMDEREVARRYGDRLCIWAGFDVQRIIPYGTPDEVRREVRFMIDTYFRPDGRFILAAGNNMTPDTPLGSLDALLDESMRYGARAAARANKG